MKARLLGPRMFLPDGCTAMSSEEGSLIEKTLRAMSVSVTNTMNLPRMLLYVSPGFCHLHQVRIAHMKPFTQLPHAPSVACTWL